MARLTNQIIFVCAFLTNFLPALVPLQASTCTNEDVEEYFAHLPDSDTDSLSSVSETEFESFASESESDF